MAKLKARGRQEIARLVKERDLPGNDSFSHEKKQIALMSDGNVLKRRVLTWRDPGYSSEKAHDYGWKVEGKIKAGITPEDFIAVYLKSGYALESSSPNFLVRRGNTIENLTGKPVITEAKAARAKKAQETRQAKPKSPARQIPGGLQGDLTGDGPGYYVTNRYVGNTSSSLRVAEVGPFRNLDLAENAAWDRYNSFRGMKFDYLLPVKIIETTSRQKAEADEGHTWWIDGLRKGPPVHPRQTGFAF